MPDTANPTAEPVDTDVVVIGAGPVGLFQVFQLGLLEIKAHVVDSLPMPGGQCLELYADKPIYDIPGVPLCTGRTLTDNLLQQMAPFRAPLHLGQEVTQLQRQAGGRFLVATSAGTHLRATAVVVAAGVGAFQPRTLKVDALAPFAGGQMTHRPGDATRFAGQRVVVAGDADDALDAACTLAEAAGASAPAGVWLLHRRDAFRATPAAVARMQELRDAGRLHFVAGQPVDCTATDGRLTHLHVATADGGVQLLAVDALLVLMGLSPRLGPVADWGLQLERKQVVVDTAQFQTSTPGIFAVGDINTYPGKKKLILSGFHEAALAAYGIAALVFPNERVLLQYTTTSPKLHRLLGVQTPPAE